MGCGMCFLLRKSSIGNNFFVQCRIVSGIKSVHFVSHRMSYIVVRGSWLNIALKVDVPSDDSKYILRGIIAGFMIILRPRGGAVFETLGYKPKCRGFNSRKCQ
jgi:hypothetical protein